MPSNRIRQLALIGLFCMSCATSCDQSTGPAVADRKDQSKTADQAAPTADETEAPAVTETTDVATKRIAVGDRAPNFVLQDQMGEEQSLGDLLTQGMVALVFYRSADW